MIADRQEIQDFIDGHWDEVVVEGPPPPPGKVIALQPRPGARAMCWIRVTDSWPLRDGRRSAVRGEKVPPPRPRRRPEKLRLLGRSGGYTSNPEAAMRDTTIESDTELGPPPEPEAVDELTQARFARMGRQADEVRRLDRLRRELTERLDRIIEAAERTGLDATREIAAIDRRIKEVERKLRRRAA